MNQVNLTTTMPELQAEVNYLPTLDDVGVVKESVVNIINDALSTLLPEYMPHLTFLFSIFIAIILMKKYQEDYVFAIWVSIVIFGFLRWLGIGG